MIVPPQIVSRPGQNSTPFGACKIKGTDDPKAGPYACYMGEFYSREGVHELARELGLLVPEIAEKRILESVNELASLRARVESAAAKEQAAIAARAEAEKALEAVTTERDKLKLELANTKSANQLMHEFLTPSKGSK